MKHRHRTVRIQALFDGDGQASVCSCGAARLWAHGPSGYRARGSWRVVEGLRRRKSTPKKAKAELAPAQVKCHFCPKLVSAADNFCHGCQVPICEGCDLNLERIGMGRTHNPDQHRYDPLSAGEED